MKTINYLAPNEFNTNHLIKLNKGISMRFRFDHVSVMGNSENKLIKVNYSDRQGIVNEINDYVNGFFAAIE